VQNNHFCIICVVLDLLKINDIFSKWNYVKDNLQDMNFALCEKWSYSQFKWCHWTYGDINNIYILLVHEKISYLYVDDGTRLFI
jgi:hypothetical protein